MQGIAEVGGSHLALIDILTIALIDNYAVGYFHYAALDSLEFITSASQLDEQEEINHRVACRLTLTNTDSFNKYLVESGSLAEDNGLTSLAGHTAQ